MSFLACTLIDPESLALLEVQDQYHSKYLLVILVKHVFEMLTYNSHLTEWGEHI
jgi:hypothetical protein